MNKNEVIEQDTVLVEDMKLSLIEKKRELLEKQLKTRLSLPMTKVEPTFDYENTSEWLELMKEELQLNVQENLIQLQEYENAIKRNRLDRAEIKELRGN